MDQQIILTPVPLTDLVGQIARAVRTELDANPQAAPSAPEELLSRTDTAKMLGVTLPTLRDYTRRGYLAGYRIGARVRYKRSEVLNSLQQMRTGKTARK